MLPWARWLTVSPRELATWLSIAGAEDGRTKLWWRYDVQWWCCNPPVLMPIVMLWLWPLLLLWWLLLILGVALILLLILSVLRRTWSTPLCTSSSCIADAYLRRISRWRLMLLKVSAALWAHTTPTFVLTFTTINVLSTTRCIALLHKWLLGHLLRSAWRWHLFLFEPLRRLITTLLLLLWRKRVLAASCAFIAAASLAVSISSAVSPTCICVHILFKIIDGRSK